MLRSRKFLVTQQTKIKNHILSICRRLGLNYNQESGRKTHWHSNHREWLTARINEIKVSALKVNLKILLKQYEDVTKNIELYEPEVAHLSEKPIHRKTGGDHASSAATPSKVGRGVRFCVTLQKKDSATSRD